TISYDGAGITTPTTITSTSTGSFTGSITVPSSAAGPHTVKATDASSNSASASFTVTITSKLMDIGRASTSTTVNISVNNFTAKSGITISYDGAGITTPTTITSTSTGSFTGSITVPSSAAGPHTVNATDASSNSASASFTVTITSKLTVTTQDMVGNAITGFSMILKQAGTTVATGFTPVSFTLNNTLQYTLTARGFGSYVFDH